jgi:hypothetical protein
MRIATSGRAVATLAAVLLFGADVTAGAELASKRYRFSANQNLTIELSAGGTAVRSVLFEFPGAVMGFRSSHRAKVKVVNEGEQSVKLGLSIALFDDQDRLVGVATAGTRGISLKPGEESDFNLPFHNLTEHLESAAFFFIAIEIH